MDPIDFAERKADELMRHHLEDMEILNKEAHHTFAFAMVVLSASFSYLLKLYNSSKVPAEQDWAWLAPVLALTMHLGLTAAYLLLRAMMTRDVMPQGNLPVTLIGDSAPNKDNLTELRRAEMWGLATRIEFNSTRNRNTARVINRTRVSLLLAPITFLVAWTAAQVVVAAA